MCFSDDEKLIDRRVNPDAFLQQLQRDALWSDPSPRLGLNLSVRGAGVAFGSDVAKLFMKNNALELVVRSHECVPRGFHFPFAEVDGNYSVVTLFSASNYGGNDVNKGAVMILEPTAGPPAAVPAVTVDQVIDQKMRVPISGSVSLSYSIHEYNINKHVAARMKKSFSSNSHTLHDLVKQHRSRLLPAFRQRDKDHDGLLALEEWATTLTAITETSVDWKQAAALLIPPSCWSTDNRIQYELFLEQMQGNYLTSPESSHTESSCVLVDHLYNDKARLQNAFSFFDIQEVGYFNKTEFLAGCEKLNATLANILRFQNFDAVFQLLDLTSSGTVHANEFFEVFRIADVAHQRVTANPTADLSEIQLVDDSDDETVVPDHRPSVSTIRRNSLEIKGHVITVD